MIKGVGIDIVKVDRIKKMKEVYGVKFLNRIYSRRELEYSLRLSRPFETLAGKFAAKEAIIKASGIKLPFKKIEILNNSTGAPFTNIPNTKISISHEKEYAIAIAITEEEQT